MMILYYTPGTCALGCLVVMRSTGVEFSLCRVAREQRQSPAYLAINPRGQVPALAIGHPPASRVLTENSAILQHLGAHAGRGLLPPDGTEARDSLNFWLSWLDSGFHVAFYPFFKPQRYLADDARHDELREASKPVIAAAFDVLEAHLAPREWMLGDGVGLLDPYVFSMTRWGERVFGDLSRWPGVHAHRERMLRDPHMRWGLAVESGEIVHADGAFRGHVELR